MKLNDAVIGALLLALAAFVLVHVGSFPNIRGQNIGPAAFPRVLAVLLGVCAVLLIGRGWRARHAVAWVEIAAWVRTRRFALRFALALAGLVGYAAWSESLGFIASGVLLIAPLFMSLGLRARSALPLALALALATHTVFYSLLRVPLPWGVLQPLAW